MVRSRKLLVLGLALVVIALVATAGCGNQSGNVAATKTGDTSNPLERGDPLAELRKACGSDGLTLPDQRSLLREPYLQQVTSSSVMVGWLTSDPTGQRLEVTTADGRAMPASDPESEQTGATAVGGRQMWARIDGLEPDTIYCYTLVNGGAPMTERIAFRTAPAANTTRPIRFLAFGDSGGGGADQLALLDQMLAVRYELVLHTGDLAYDHGTLAEFEDTVFGVYGELLRHIPLFPAAGNHEYDTLDGAPFRDVFALPGDSGEQWYSYDWGPIHFAALDTEASYATQMAWLDEDLASSSLPWKIVYLHRPPYSSGEKHGSDLALRAALEPVLEKHGVQLVLAGHDHHYERILPQKGVTHVVTGGGGVGTRSAGTSSFTAISDEVIHFVTGVVDGDELVLHAIDATGQMFDSVVIPRVAK